MGLLNKATNIREQKDKNSLYTKANQVREKEPQRRTATQDRVKKKRKKR
jgi:hypothetical protein